MKVMPIVPSAPVSIDVLLEHRVADFNGWRVPPRWMKTWPETVLT